MQYTLFKKERLIMGSQDSKVNLQSLPTQSDDGLPSFLDQAGFRKSLSLVQEVRERFESSEPAKYSTFLEVMNEANVTPMESQEEWQAMRAEKQAEARLKLEELFKGQEDLLEKLDAFLPAPSTQAGN
ncbi:hypothetical protein BDP55DRAFT_674939 [Colletotrichum godetiae]|uniref:Uncharacterized protein n=1 Tax=Colletotrichum godetiae TaxID=1209918 RepID=A0AAJ0EU09_9PEZI|nr:uncharacterized protein BDP55DRAFT_674939 [Colletotrichum godetiae]KAK1671830.1 hypothetical protein BDP55DRAFT_674939 [Colletotrichum godetiae]